MQNVENILKDLKKRGYRCTNIRTVILTLITKSSEPLTYFDIKHLLLKKSVSADKATIYRELAFLKEQQIIKELSFEYDVRHYELMPENHHHHAICTKCETINHIELKKDLEETEKQIAKHNNFKVFRHSLEFYGLCHKCQLHAK